VVYSIKRKTQQSSIWIKIPKSTAKEKISQRDIKRIFQMLRKVSVTNSKTLS